MLQQMIDNLSSFFGSGSNIMFLIFALLAIGGAVFMLNLTKVVHMVTSLAVTFISLAAIYILLQAEFVAVVQVLIYAGAITILMIFAIMMTNHREIDQSIVRPLHQGLVLIGVILLGGLIFYAVQRAAFPAPDVDLATNNTENIGLKLFHEHVIPFELMSVLLTVAFIGAIIIAKREED
jgi:NADH-quinone oxidoreductase subunit J